MTLDDLNNHLQGFLKPNGALPPPKYRIRVTCDGGAVCPDVAQAVADLGAQIKVMGADEALSVRLTIGFFNIHTEREYTPEEMQRICLTVAQVYMVRVPHMEIQCQMEKYPNENSNLA